MQKTKTKSNIQYYLIDMCVDGSWRLGLIQKKKKQDKIRCFCFLSLNQIQEISLPKSNDISSAYTFTYSPYPWSNKENDSPRREIFNP